MTRFAIDVYADTACPWSYVGKEFMDKAIREWRASRPDDEFDVVWKPFYLHPYAKESGTCSSQPAQTTRTSEQSEGNP